MERGFGVWGLGWLSLYVSHTSTTMPVARANCSGTDGHPPKPTPHIQRTASIWRRRPSCGVMLTTLRRAPPVAPGSQQQRGLDDAAAGVSGRRRTKKMPARRATSDDDIFACCCLRSVCGVGRDRRRVSRSIMGGGKPRGSSRIESARWGGAKARWCGFLGCRGYQSVDEAKTAMPEWIAFKHVENAHRKRRISHAVVFVSFVSLIPFVAL